MKQETKESIDRYVADRIPTGGFLEAVLCNNLKEALGRADTQNLKDIKEIVEYCYWEIPGVCWGSPEKVRAWLLVDMTAEQILKREA